MNREILRLAIPNILSNISVPLLSSFDTALMGDLSGNHIAAVGLGSMAFNFIYWNFGFLRMGSTGLTAQAYGRKAQIDMAAVLGRAFIVALVVAIILLLLQWPVNLLTNELLNIRGQQIGMVNTYFYIRIWAAPAALGLMALFGWFFGMQNAIYPLILTLIINVVNMILSYYLVVSLGYGIAGAAWGTVVAQYLGLGVAIVLLFWRYSWVRPEMNSKVLFLKSELLAFLRINGDIFLRTFLLTLGFTFFYNRANTISGVGIIAGNVILLQLVNWLSHGVDGFAFAAESLVGKYYGANQPKKLNQAIRLSFFWGGMLAIGYAVVYFFFAEPIIKIFADPNAAPMALQKALEYLPLLILFCLVAAPCYIYDGIFIGFPHSLSSC
ncbi:MAG: MATE family efflux transporter [Bacteroidota bacterium]